jgi:VCBS repeat-containing protein
VNTGSVTEDVAVVSGNLTTSGVLTIADADQGQSNFTVQASTLGSNGFGTFTLAANGAWTYTANNSQAAIQQLNAGQSLTDSFTAVSSDGTASQIVTVTIHGTNDAFLIAPGAVLVLQGETLTYPLIENDGTIQTGSNNPSTILGSIITGTGQTGTIEIKNNTTLEIDGSVDSGQTVLFSVDPGGGANSLLKLKDPSEFRAKISDFDGNDQIDLLGVGSILGKDWKDNPGTNTGGTLTLTAVTSTGDMITIVLTFIDGDYTIDNFKFASDGQGGTLLSDPPASTTTSDATLVPVAATLIPVAESSTLPANETASRQRKATSATDDEAIMVALSTAVAVALSAAASDADGREIPSLTTSGDDTALDISGTVSGSDSSVVNSGTAPNFDPIWHRMAETVTDNETVEVVEGNLEIAGAVSETGMFKADAEATLQVGGSEAPNALVITDGTNTDAINLSGHYTIYRAQNDGRGGKVAHDPSLSASAEETPVQSTSPDNAFIVSTPLTELSGNHSAFQFKPNLDHHAVTDPKINYLAEGLPQQSLHMPAQLAHSGLLSVTDEAHPAHFQFDGSRWASFKLADDGSAHPGKASHDAPPLTPLSGDLSKDHSAHPFKPNLDHHESADPEIGGVAHAPQHPADNLPHTPAQHGDNGSSTVSDRAHSAHFENFKFADDGSAHPGKASHAPPSLTAPSSDLSEDHSAHPFKPKLEHYASAEPEIGDIAKDHLPEHPADNSPPVPAQLAENSLVSVTDDNFKFADDGGAHPGTAPYDPPTVTALSSDLSGTHGPIAPAPANGVPGTVMSDTASDQFIFGKGLVHHTVADIKPDMTETDHNAIAEIQHLLHTAHDTNAVSALDPNHTTAPQDMTKIQLPHQHGDFHFA